MADDRAEPENRWRTEHPARAAKLFPNQGIQSTATLMASSHERALDYLEQAPVIVLAATRGHTPLRGIERAYLTGQIAEKARRGDKLRDVMADYGMAFPLRKIKASVLGPSKWSVVFRLSRIPPSSLSQSIPEDAPTQRAWLACLESWSETAARRQQSNPWFGIEWAAFAFRSVHWRDRHIAGPLADFACNNPDAFNEKWTLQQAMAAQDRWHQTLARRSEAAKAMAKAGVGFDVPIDYSPLPTTAEIDGISFIALQTGEDLFVEGATMRHCVASYISQVVAGSSRIYSLREGGRRLATLELVPKEITRTPREYLGAGGAKIVAYEKKPAGWYERQLRGPCNAPTLKRTREAAAEFVRQLTPSVSSPIGAPHD